MQTRASVIETCSPSVGLELQVLWPFEHCVPAWLTTVNTRTPGLPRETPGMRCRSLLLEDLGASWTGLLEACSWFPLDFFPVPFPFADFALYPFTVMNDNGENYNF